MPVEAALVETMRERRWWSLGELVTEISRHEASVLRTIRRLLAVGRVAREWEEGDDHLQGRWLYRLDAR